MTDRENVIKGLEYCIDYAQRVNDLINDVPCDGCPYVTLKPIAVGQGNCMDMLLKDALALLKAHEQATIEPKRIDLADETKAWLDKMDAVDALENISSICLDWDGYRTANGLGGLINEIWAYARYCADRLLKAQEPEALDMPKPDSEIGCWYDITHNYTLEQVVSALKAQEPRVMTVADIVDNYVAPEVVWVEARNNKGDIRLVAGLWNGEYYNMADDSVLYDLGEEIANNPEGYNTRWRCWTSRPTKEQREKEPWNG